METKYSSLALLVLRVGVTVPFIMNGLDALNHSDELTQLVTSSGLSPVSPAILLTLIGISDLTISTLLILGLWTKKVAILATLWVAIVTFVLFKTGATDDAMNHLPFITSAFALIFLGSGEWNIKKIFKRS